MSQNIRWDGVMKKEATGIDDYDLGKVQQVEPEVIVREKGIINKERYYLPKNLVEDFDGHTLSFRIMKAEAKQFRRYYLIRKNN